MIGITSTVFLVCSTLVDMLVSVLIRGLYGPLVGALDTNTLNMLRASPEVATISEDGLMHTMTTQYLLSAPKTPFLC